MTAVQITQVAQTVSAFPEASSVKTPEGSADVEGYSSQFGSVLTKAVGEFVSYFDLPVDRINQGYYQPVVEGIPTLGV